MNESLNNKTEKNETFEFNGGTYQIWTISDILNALIQAGLVIALFGEHSDKYWNSFPNLKPELRERIPLTFSILATKPALPNR